VGDISTNFSRHEFACQCGCGFDTVDAELVNKVLEPTRAHFSNLYFHMQIRMKITSGCRCYKHNLAEGGSDGSYHKKGQAADWYLYDDLTGWKVPEEDVYAYLEETYPMAYGIGRYKNRNHTDIRPYKVRWDKR